MKNKRMRIRAMLMAAIGAVSVSPPTLWAVTVPFTEDFASDAANWRDGVGTSLLEWHADDGPDRGSFVSGRQSFGSLSAGAFAILYRAQEDFGSSGGAFQGSWVADDVTEIRYLVRQHTGVPLTFFTRFRGPGPGFVPAAAVLEPVSVASDTWTEISVPLPSAGMIFEGPFSFDQVFGNIGRLQVGVVVPPGLAGNTESFAFDLDKVAIVPEPATWALLTIGAVAGLRRRLRGVRGT
ncbi:MAG: PEP-CTERM sorting domain-containing protein [Planctomycetota bacterium]